MMQFVRRHGLLVLVVLVALAGFVVTLTAPASNPGRVAGALAGWVGVFAFLHERAYHRARPYRLAVDRFVSRFSGHEVRWEIRGEFDAAAAGIALAAVRETVGTLEADVQDLASGLRSSVWRIDDVVVKVSVQPIGGALDDVTSVLAVEMVRETRPVRGLNRTLERTIAPLFERVEDAVQPSATKYVSSVEFPRGNPYFGLFVADVDPNLVGRFDLMLFEETATGRNPVYVTKDSVKVVTNSLGTVERLSRGYIALRDPGRHAA